MYIAFILLFSLYIFFRQSCFGSSMLYITFVVIVPSPSLSKRENASRNSEICRELRAKNIFAKWLKESPATSSCCHNWTRTNSQNWFWKYFARFSSCKRNFHRNKNSSTLCFKTLLIISRRILISHNLRQCMVPYLNLDISFLFETWTLFSFVVHLAKLKRT